MIKFFRKIRQNLLSEGKTGKYLKYAIGEIILVVIGILIALQINNWNINNQQEKLETKYLKEIRNNLKSDLPDINFNIEFNESRLRSNEIVLQYLNREIDYSDSLKFHFGNLIFTTRTLPNISAYESLKSRGLEIITNDTLRQNITSLYSFLYHNVIDFEKQDDNSFQYGLFIPEVSKAFNIQTVWKSAVPIEEQKIPDNYQLKNAITTNILIRKYMLTQYYELKKSVGNCINQIDTELKKERKHNNGNRCTTPIKRGSF
jgi:hypothetical protein